MKCNEFEIKGEYDHCYGRLGEYQATTRPAVIREEGFRSENSSFPKSERSWWEKREKIPLTVHLKPEGTRINSWQITVENSKTQINATVVREGKEEKIPVMSLNPQIQKYPEPVKEIFTDLDDDFTLSTTEEDEEFYKNLEKESCFYQNYLDEPVLYNGESVSGLTSNDSRPLNSGCEQSEEYLELKAAFERMNSPMRPVFCICDPYVVTKRMLPLFTETFVYA